jgi:hypothetical protein
MSRIDWIFTPTLSLPIEDCVVIERLKGEAIGFQRFRMRVFKVWKTSVGLKSNVFVRLPIPNQNGKMSLL